MPPIDFKAISQLTKQLVNKGEDGYHASMMALWMVMEGITLEEAQERVDTLWLD